MSQQPFSSAALRGAVDLSGLGARPAGPGAGRPAPRPGAAPQGAPSAAGGAPGAGGTSALGVVGAVPGRVGAVVEADDASFESVVTASLTTPLVLVLWTPQVPESREHLLELARLAKDKDGRFQVVAVDLAGSPGIMQALTPILQETFGQVSALPVVLGLLGGQPMPFYLGPQDVSRVDPLLDSFLEAAVTNAVTGRVDVSGPLPRAAGAEPAPEEDEDGLSAEHQAAYDAIEQGDWDEAVAAYERALAADPGDELARLGLGQVTLLRRTSRLDLAAVRQAAAERPDDVQAQIEAADVDVVGGHVEDAFLRLVDTVRRTTGAERDAARTHLLGLFEVVGPADPRVVKGRSALMSALF